MMGDHRNAKRQCPLFGATDLVANGNQWSMADRLLKPCRKAQGSGTEANIRRSILDAREAVSVKPRRFGKANDNAGYRVYRQALTSAAGRQQSLQPEPTPVAAPKAAPRSDNPLAFAA
jgi:hypothetical protein